MDKECIGQMLRLIVSQDGVSLSELAGACSLHPGTAKRRVRWLREVYGAPITSSRHGYYWRPAPHQKRRADALITVFCEE